MTTLKRQFFIFLSSFIIIYSGQLIAHHHPEDFLNRIRGSKDEGQQIVLSFCSTCHAQKPMIEVGAPKIGNAMDWKMRVEQGLNRLFEHTVSGFGVMPPRGGCFECTDEQLLLAIKTLLSEEK